jgi:transcriptional regulator with XRE-family HTH domain
MAKKSLTEQENDRLRELVRKTQNERFNGNASDVAVALGVSQSFVSRFLSGGSGASSDLALKVAAILGMDVLEVLGRKPGAPSPIVKPAPPAAPVSQTVPAPISDVRVPTAERIAARKMVQSCMDKGRHDYADGTLVEDALMVGAPFMRGLDPTDYVRRLLDTAAKYRERGQPVEPKDLHNACFKRVIEENNELRAQLATYERHKAEAVRWNEDVRGGDAPPGPRSPRPKSGASRR